MTSRSLYTIFLEFRGGTYVSQIRGVSPFEALWEWAKAVPEADLDDWHLRRDELLPIIQQDSLVPLSDRVNVWCLSGVGDDDEQIMMNVVATVES